MPDEHARLSPSAAERWLSCPASVLLSTQYPHGSSVWADEGTTAHTMGELKAQLYLLDLPEPQRRRAVTKLALHRQYVTSQGYDLEEMEEHTDAYVEHLAVLLQEEPAALFLEQRLQTGIPMCWGTGDAILVSPLRIRVVDLKYGKGIMVGAYENPQLMLYGVGALERYGDVVGDIEEVSVTIFQPRLEHVSTFSLPAADLVAWRDSLLPVAAEALQPGAHFGPSEKACRFCPAAGDCRARMDYVVAQDFSIHPDRLSGEELADALELVPAVTSWAKSVQEYALQTAMSTPGAIPRWKVVLSNGRRSIVDQAVAIQTAIDHGWLPEQISRVETKPIGDLERLLGKDGFSELFGPFTVKGEGKPALVSADDPRPPVDKTAEAAKDFSEG
ncbi:DUF2800 domain-containing protein [Tessaracoccus sp.]